MFISMVMLVVPVIPHHHHNNGLICMKNDIAPIVADNNTTRITNIAVAIRDV